MKVDFRIEIVTRFDIKVNLVKGEIMENIFAKLKAHLLEGMVFHDEMMRYYGFLQMYECKDEHEEHYLKETEAYHALCDYYSNHYNMLIPTLPMARPDVIPESWYKYTRQEVDEQTLKNAKRVGLKKWIEWEKKTKDLYQSACKELFELGEVASAIFVSQLVVDVDEELKEAMKHA